MPKIERKYLAHFLDAKFGVKTQGEETYTPNYTRLGKDLEEYNEELNPDVEVNKNILGEQNVVHNGYGLLHGDFRRRFCTGAQPASEACKGQKAGKVGA